MDHGPGAQYPAPSKNRNVPGCVLPPYSCPPFIVAPFLQVTPAQLKALEVRLRGINELAVVQHATKAAVEVCVGEGEGEGGAACNQGGGCDVEVGEGRSGCAGEQRKGQKRGRALPPPW